MSTKKIESSKAKKIGRKYLYIFWISLFFLLFFFWILYSNTGIFQSDLIDSRDLEKWSYENGIISGADGFSIAGKNQTCWILIHSYAATPLEMKSLAERINLEFNDLVLVPRLSGHSQVPSGLMGKNLSVWYEEIESVYIQLSENCTNINLAGSSFGGALSLRLAEEKKIKNLYLIDAYVGKTLNFLPNQIFELALKLSSDLFFYQKKKIVANIHCQNGLKEHIAYINFPFRPGYESLPFLSQTEKSVNFVNSSVLIQHSINDPVASYLAMKKVFRQISSSDKEFISYYNSSHILLLDYDKEQVINSIINFERKRR